MPRSRVIKPEFWEDEKLGSISIQARLVFVGMWTFSDDYGVIKGHATLLKNKIFPYDDLKKGEFEKWLEELEKKAKVIMPFMHNQEKFYFIKHFKDHQRVDKPSKTNYPNPPESILEMLASDSRDSSEIFANDLRDSSDQEEEEEEEEVKRKRKRKRKEETTPPSEIIREWSEYVKKSFEEILADEAWIKQKEDIYPLVNIKKTIQEESDYWSSAEGFEKRKGKTSCDWKSTLCKAFKADWRYIPNSPDKKGKFQVSQRDSLLDY